MTRADRHRLLDMWEQLATQLPALRQALGQIEPDDLGQIEPDDLEEA